MNDDMFEMALQSTKTAADQAPIMMFKLSSGETVIAKVVGDAVEEGKESDPQIPKLLIEDPFQIKQIDTPIENGTRTITYYAEWFIGAETRSFLLCKDHIISAAYPTPAVRVEYARLVARKSIVIAETPPMQKVPETAAVMGHPTPAPKKDWSITQIDGKDRFKHS